METTETALSHEHQQRINAHNYRVEEQEESLSEGLICRLTPAKYTGNCYACTTEKADKVIWKSKQATAFYAWVSDFKETVRSNVPGAFELPAKLVDSLKDLDRKCERPKERDQFVMKRVQASLGIEVMKNVDDFNGYHHPFFAEIRADIDADIRRRTDKKQTCLWTSADPSSSFSTLRVDIVPNKKVLATTIALIKSKVDEKLKRFNAMGAEARKQVGIANASRFVEIRKGDHRQTPAEWLLAILVAEGHLSLARDYKRLMNDINHSETFDAQIECLNKIETALKNVEESNPFRQFERNCFKYNWCCTDPACRIKMGIGFASKEQSADNKESDDVDALFNLQTPLLGVLARRVGIEAAKQASKTAFLWSSFCKTRQSHMAAAATALLQLHDRTMFTDDERVTAKHDASVNNLALALGFWSVYFAPSFDLDMTNLDSFLHKLQWLRKKFLEEKGNAVIDATLVYRVIQLKYKRNSSFCKTVRYDDELFKYVRPTESTFRGQTAWNRFRESVTKRLRFTNRTGKAGNAKEWSTHVRQRQTSQMEFDPLVRSIQCNLLGFDSEARHVKDTDEKVTLTSVAPLVNKLNTKRVDNHFCKLITAAADRLEAIRPGYWKSNVASYPSDDDVARFRSKFKMHPVVALFKDPITKDDYKCATEWPEESDAIYKDPFQNPDVVAQLDLMPSLPSLHRPLDVELALASLLTGRPYFKRAARPKPTMAQAVSAIEPSGESQKLIQRIRNESIRIYVVQFANDLIRTSMRIQFGSQMSAMDPEDCRMRATVRELIDNDFVAHCVTLHDNSVQSNLRPQLPLDDLQRQKRAHLSAGLPPLFRRRKRVAAERRSAVRAAGL